MKKKLAGIAELVGQDVMVRLNRKPIDNFSLDGFVVGFSDKLLCLHVVDGKTLMLNGYSIVRLSDIHSYRVDEAAFIDRALRLLGRVPIAPDGFDLSGWGLLLSSVQPRYSLVSISTEKDASRCLFIGRLVKHTKRSVVIEAVDVGGHWEGQQEFAYKDITMLDLGDGYVNALAAVMADEDTLFRPETRG
jgi:hypothetical protein